MGVNYYYYSPVPHVHLDLWIDVSLRLIYSTTLFHCDFWSDISGNPGTARNSLNQPNVWLTIFLTSLLCTLPVVAFRFIIIQLQPTINDKVM